VDYPSKLIEDAVNKFQAPGLEATAASGAPSDKEKENLCANPGWTNSIECKVQLLP
jgi:hypothetical protein